MKITVTAFIFNEDKLLVVFHKKLKKWMHVGGHVEPNEFFSEALEREILEETKLKVSFLKIETNTHSNSEESLPFFIQHSEGTERKILIDYIVITKNPEDIQIQKSELEGFKWISKDELENIDSFPVFLDIARKAFEFYEKNRFQNIE